MSYDLLSYLDDRELEALMNSYFNQAFGVGNKQMYATVLSGIGYFNAPASRGTPHGQARRAVEAQRERDAEAGRADGCVWRVLAAQGIAVPCMLHDLVKCRCYRAVEGAGPAWEYVQPEYHGHGACSVAIAAELGIRLMREEIAAIMFHMGPWGVDKEYSDGEFRAAMRAFAPQIIAAHTADWYAAEVDEPEVLK